MTQLKVGDVVLVNIDKHNQIGIIKYIGCIDGYDEMTQYVGMELVESIDNGHNGTINGYQYFQCVDGHGIYVGINNIIRKLNIIEVAIQMQQFVIVLKSKLDQYSQALSQRNEYIKKLKNNQRYLSHLFKQSQQIIDNTTDNMILSAMSPITTESDSTTNSTVILNNIAKKSCIFKVRTSSSQRRYHSEYKHRNDHNHHKLEPVDIDQYSSSCDEEEATETESSDNDEDELSDKYDDDDSSIDIGNKAMMYSPYSKNGISKSSPIQYVNNNKLLKEKHYRCKNKIRRSKLEKTCKSKSYSPQNGPKNASIPSLNKSISHDMECMPQKQYLYNHMNYNNDENKRLSIPTFTQNASHEMTLPNQPYSNISHHGYYHEHINKGKQGIQFSHRPGAVSSHYDTNANSKQNMQFIQPISNLYVTSKPMRSRCISIPWNPVVDKTSNHVFPQNRIINIGDQQQQQQIQYAVSNNDKYDGVTNNNYNYPHIQNDHYCIQQHKYQ